MSDYLAVAGVSTVLCSLLTTALTVDGPKLVLGASPPGITALSPSLIQTGRPEPPQLNLFMYYISLNPALRNLDLPSTNKHGDKLSNPPLALNLHYLVSAYGSEQFDPEVLLGFAMKVFHDTPVVPRQTIQQALVEVGTGASPGSAAALIANSTLANQIEHIRITPEALTTEEIYRLWPAFHAAYRPSTAIQISVIVIQDTQAFRSSLPVQTRTVTAVALPAPIIDSVSTTMVPAGQTLTITGRNFLGDDPADTLVSFGEGQSWSPDALQGNVIRIAVPAELWAGTRTVRIQRRLASSSPVPFQRISTILGGSIFPAHVGAALQLDLAPVVGNSQQATLYIGERAIPIDDRPAGGLGYSSQVEFPIPPDLPTGVFPLRVEIDGAKSSLAISAANQVVQAQVEVQP